MSKSQRDKGQRGEREAAALLQRVYPDACRKVANDANHENGVDLDNTGALRVQVKRHKRPAPVTALYEIRSDGIHVLLTRGDGGEWLAVLRAADLVDIIEDVAIAYDD
ncbi:MAG: hypothetical protein M9928_21785 [Anaerolineae bacterium]|nr:hypothetical protein [Anaerolineae bacterium]MCO5195457.1 hypothetical protein [Anaerolineae bacterium]MCO5199985.1 hypothetical protein [Anaerolineae bacterium]MCO5207648.1 hypothetical protein [Anaerolineae bacterium]